MTARAIFEQPLGARVLTGLIGRDIQKSRSPQMHQEEAKAQGIALGYRLFDFAALNMGERDLAAFLEDLEGFGYVGVNVTHPYKQAVIPLLSELSDGARRVGAVNTIAFRNGKRFGFNTDVTGFAQSFCSGLPGAEIEKVFQAGAGGAGAATAYAMLDMGAQNLVIYDKDQERARALCETLQRVFGIERVSLSEDVDGEVAAANGVINATPLGMAEYPGCAIPLTQLSPQVWVADIVYFPLETDLIRGARQRGCRVLDGGGMAVYQAAGAFEVFTGKTADASRMRHRFLSNTHAVP